MATCQHCGQDSYYAREFPRVRDEKIWWERRARQYAGEVASLKLTIEQAAWKDKTDFAWLQGKVVAQRREIKRLNDERNAARLRFADADPLPDVDVSSATKTEVGARTSRAS